MVKLIAQTPCAGLLPKTVGGVAMAEPKYEAIQSVAPLKGHHGAVARRLQKALGVELPEPNRRSGKGPFVLWVGPGQYLVLGRQVAGLEAIAAVTDQSDAWAIVELSGPTITDVLSRLVPIDLRGAKFELGHTARTLIGHMPCSITRTGTLSIEVMVMRSMAGTLVHEISEAARLYAARG